MRDWRVSPVATQQDGIEFCNAHQPYDSRFTASGWQVKVTCKIVDSRHFYTVAMADSFIAACEAARRRIYQPDLPDAPCGKPIG